MPSVWTRHTVVATAMRHATRAMSIFQAFEADTTLIRGLTLSATCILRSYAPLLRGCQESRLPFNVKGSCGGVKRVQRQRPLFSASAHHAQGWQSVCAWIAHKHRDPRVRQASVASYSCAATTCTPSLCFLPAST